MNVLELFATFGFKTDTSGLKSIKSALNSLRASVALLGLGRLASGLMGIAEHAGETATHLLATSQALGLTIEQTQEWGYVAEQSGSNLKEFATAMGMFEGNLRKVANGTASKKLKADFAELGFDQSKAKTATSSANNMNQALLNTADKIKSFGKGAPEAGILTQLAFGKRGGRAMAADLARGREGVETLMRRRRELGEIDEKEANTLRDLHNRTQDVHRAFTAIAMKVVADVAPGFLDMADGAIKWIAANRDLISGALKTAFDALATVLGTIAKAVVLVANLIRDAFDGDEGAIGILTAFAAVIIGLVMPSFVALGVAIWTALAPIALIALAIAAIVVVILLVRNHWDEIVAFFKKSWTDIKASTAAFWNWLVGIADTVGNRVMAVVDRIKQFFSDAWQFIKDTVSSVIDWITEKVTSAKNAVIDFAKWAARFMPGGDTVLQVMNQAKMGSPATAGTGAPAASARSSKVTVGPTTVNINGVKGAAEAKDGIRDAIDRTNRSAYAALGGS